MTTAQFPPGHYLKPHLSEKRIRQTWAQISARALRKEPDRLRRVAVPAMVLAACIGAVVLFAGRRPAPPVLTSGDMTIASQAVPRSFALAAAEVTLEPFAAVMVGKTEPREQRLTVVRGSARFHVAHDPARRFVVTAGPVEVEDVGTDFTVAREGREGETVRVAVTSGEVQVRVDSRAPYPLHAGESFTTPVTPPEASAVAPTGTSGGTVDALRDPARSPSSAEIPSLGTDPRSSATSGPSGPSGSSMAEVVTAKSLLADAMAARQASDFAAEVLALDTLRRRFPRDPRAPIAAFELGLVRMDKLHNRSGALEALRAAISLAPGASFREDAEARVVTLLAESHDVAACRSARDAFLSRYPGSVHRDTVERRCPSP